jgi:hypothetical protein
MSSELEDKIARYYALKPSKFPVVKSFSITQAPDSKTGEMQQHLSIVFAKDHSFCGEMLYLDLLGVRNLQFDQPSWSLISLSNITIANATPAGKFDRRLVVRDAEQEKVFGCSCHDFRVAVKQTKLA